MGGLLCHEARVFSTLNIKILSKCDILKSLLIAWHCSVKYFNNFEHWYRLFKSRMLSPNKITSVFVYNQNAILRKRWLELQLYKKAGPIKTSQIFFHRVYPSVAMWNFVCSHWKERCLSCALAQYKPCSASWIIDQSWSRVAMKRGGKVSLAALK